MSTSCVITVIEGEGANEQRYSIYRHSDGYPDSEHGVIATLEQVLSFAWPLPRFEAADFAAAIVAAWKTRGGGIYLTAHATPDDGNFHYEIRQHPTETSILTVRVHGDKTIHYLPNIGPLGILALEGKRKRVRA